MSSSSWTYHRIPGVYGEQSPPSSSERQAPQQTWLGHSNPAPTPTSQSLLCVFRKWYIFKWRSHWLQSLTYCQQLVLLVLPYWQREPSSWYWDLNPLGLVLYTCHSIFIIVDSSKAYSSPYHELARKPPRSTSWSQDYIMLVHIFEPDLISEIPDHCKRRNTDYRKRVSRFIWSIAILGW